MSGPGWPLPPTLVLGAVVGSRGWPSGGTGSLSLAPRGGLGLRSTSCIRPWELAGGSRGLGGGGGGRGAGSPRASERSVFGPSPPCWGSCAQAPPSEGRRAKAAGVVHLCQAPGSVLGAGSVWLDPMTCIHRVLIKMCHSGYKNTAWGKSRCLVLTWETALFCGIKSSSWRIQGGIQAFRGLVLFALVPKV